MRFRLAPRTGKDRADARTHEERRNLLAQFLPAVMLVTNASRLRGRELQEVVAAAVDGGVSMVLFRDMPLVGTPTGDSMTPRFDISPAEMIFDPSNTMYAMASVLGAVHSVGRSLMLLRGGEFAAFAAQTCARDLSAEVAVHIPDAAQADSVAARIRSTDEHLVLSRSVHNLEAAVRAEGEGADMLVLGTVFPSTSHPGGPTIGPEGVRKVCSAVSIPVIGIGGITAENASEVMAAGAGGVAVISAIFDAPDPAAAASALRHAVGALSPSPVLGEGAGG